MSYTCRRILLHKFCVGCNVVTTNCWILSLFQSRSALSGWCYVSPDKDWWLWWKHVLLIVSVGRHSCGSSRLFKVFMRYALVDYAMRMYIWQMDVTHYPWPPLLSSPLQLSGECLVSLTLLMWSVRIWGSTVWNYSGPLQFYMWLLFALFIFQTLWSSTMSCHFSHFTCGFRSNGRNVVRHWCAVLQERDVQSNIIKKYTWSPILQITLRSSFLDALFRHSEPATGILVHFMCCLLKTRLCWVSVLICSKCATGYLAHSPCIGDQCVMWMYTFTNLDHHEMVLDARPGFHTAFITWVPCIPVKLEPVQSHNQVMSGTALLCL